MVSVLVDLGQADHGVDNFHLVLQVADLNGKVTYVLLQSFGILLEVLHSHYFLVHMGKVPKTHILGQFYRTDLFLEPIQISLQFFPSFLHPLLNS